VKISAALLSCVLLCPVMAFAADPFNYDYVEANYQHNSPDTGTTAKGPGVAVAYTIWSEIQLVGGYARLDASAPVSDITYNNYYAGIRGESNFNESTDFYTDVLYLNNRTEYQSTSTTNTGYRLAVGMRHLYSRWIELDITAGHNSISQSSNDGTIGLLVNATSWLAVGVSYSHNSVTNNTSSLRVRAYF
jgi:Outer membrane protein beta-barrel domain